MDGTSICHACGRTMESVFSYCPWCGQATEQTLSLEHQFEEVFSRVETVRNGNNTVRMERIETALGNLERELSLMLSGTKNE